jgi:hypothetical protein
MQSYAASRNHGPLRMHQSGPVFGLLPLEMHDHAVQVAIKPGCQLFAHAPDFLKELVFHDARFTVSSRGVQITGISNPAC